jgi:hypothetical protein
MRYAEISKNKIIGRSKKSKKNNIFIKQMEKLTE